MREKKEKKEKKETTKRTSLFQRYLRYSLFSVMISVILLFTIFLAFLANYWRQERVDTLQSNTRHLAAKVAGFVEASQEPDDTVLSTALVCNMLTIVSDSIDADVFMTDVNGRVELCKDILTPEMNLVNEEAHCDFHDGFYVPANFVSRTTTEGYDTIARLGGPYANEAGKSGLYIVVGTAIEVNGEPYGVIYAVTPVYKGLMPYIKQIMKLLLGAALISFLLTFVLAYMFAYNLTRPLQEMSRLTKQYAKGDFSERIVTTGNDEMQDLAQSLNEMADSLSVLEDSRKSFVANVSHELKTPMTTIGGFIDGILDGTIPPNEEKHYLQIVSKEVKRLARLVVTMLTLSKIEAGEEELHFSRVEIDKLLFNALLSFEVAIEEAGYEIRGFEDMPHLSVEADPDMLFQVAYNLFDNAVKFTNRGGVIRVSAEDLGDRVAAHISNTGNGIPEQELRRIFERFYKVDKSRSEHVKGVGLGLNLTQNIVRLHGGEISVDSEEGGFTTFTFWIPKNQGDHPTGGSNHE